MLHSLHSVSDIIVLWQTDQLCWCTCRLWFVQHVIFCGPFSCLDDFCAAILYYDYTLTLINEITFFWPPKNRLTWPSLLYFITRYFAVLGHIPAFIASFVFAHNFKVRALTSSWTCETTGTRSHEASFQENFCHGVHTYHFIYIILIQFLTAVLCILRVSALYSHCRVVLTGLVLVMVATFVLLCVCIFYTTLFSPFFPQNGPSPAWTYASRFPLYLMRSRAETFLHSLPD